MISKPEQIVEVLSQNNNQGHEGEIKSQGLFFS